MRKFLASGLILSGTILLPTFAMAQELSHVNVPSHQIVNLVGSFSDVEYCGLSNQQALFRVRTTGQSEVEPFVVPSGARLVITDVIWMAGRGPSEAFFAGSTVLIHIQAYSSDVIFHPVFTGTGVHIPADTTDLINGSDHLTAGVVVAPNRRLCVTATGIRQSDEPNSFILFEHTPQLVRVSGYLINF